MAEDVSVEMLGEFEDFFFLGNPKETPQLHGELDCLEGETFLKLLLLMVPGRNMMSQNILNDIATKR